MPDSITAASHEIRIAFCREVLEGLATGDAFGEACSYSYEHVRDKLSTDISGLGSLRFTDDTEMASAVLEVLIRLKGIDEDVLAWQFRRRFHRSLIPAMICVAFMLRN